MSDEKKTALIEALNYIVRQFFFVFLGLVALIASKIILGINLETGDIDVDWLLVFNMLKAAALFSVLATGIGAVDKYKHVFAKEEDPKKTEGKSMGIVPSALQIQK